MTHKSKRQPPLEVVMGQFGTGTTLLVSQAITVPVRAEPLCISFLAWNQRVQEPSHPHLLRAIHIARISAKAS